MTKPEAEEKMNPIVVSDKTWNWKLKNEVWRWNLKTEEIMVEEIWNW